MIFEAFEDNKAEENNLIYDSVLFETMDDWDFKKLSPRS